MIRNILPVTNGGASCSRKKNVQQLPVAARSIAEAAAPRNAAG